MTPLRLQRRRSRPEVAAQLGVIAAAHADADMAVVDGADAPLVLTWTDGPAPATVATAVGALDGWTVQLVLPGEAMPVPTGVHHLVLRRDLGAAALAVAVVRFQGSQGRAFRSSADRDRAPMHALLDEDDPATSGYPVVDAMAGLLLGEPDPIDAPGRELPTPLDAMAWRLQAAGYDRLWARAWATVD